MIITIRGKTSALLDHSKEVDITIPEKLEKKYGMKLRNINQINYDKLAHPKVKKYPASGEKIYT